MKFVLGFAACLVVCDTYAAKSYPQYVTRQDGDYCTVTKQETAEHAESDIPEGELKGLAQRNRKMRDLVRSYKSYAYGVSNRLYCKEANELAKNLKRLAVPRSERYNDNLVCKANGKTYYINNHGRNATMSVANRSGGWLFFPGTESEQGSPISLRKSVRSPGCSLEFTRNANGLHGFRVCLGEGETFGKLTVNGKRVNVTCEPNGSFHDNVADSIRPDRHRGKGKLARHRGITRHGKKKHHRPHRFSGSDESEPVTEEQEIADSIDPDGGSWAPRPVYQ